MNTIFINVNTNILEITSEGDTFTFLPIITIKKNKETNFVFEIGKDTAVTHDLDKIYLFNFTAGPLNKKKKKYLDYFCAFLLKEIMVKKPFLKRLVRPVIYISNTQNLDKIFLGYQYYLLEDSFQFAGARKVIFES